MDPFWQEVNAGGLGQGDMIPACAVPVIRSDFDQVTLAPGTPAAVDVQEFDLIIMTQSCDLENGKAPLVACCPIHTLTEFESVNPDFSKIGQWNAFAKAVLKACTCSRPPKHQTTNGPLMSSTSAPSTVCRLHI